MLRISTILVAASAVLFFACASAPVAVAPVPPPAPVKPAEPAPAAVSVKPAEPAPAATPPVKKVPRVVVTRIPLETRASAFFADGSLDGYTDSERNADGLLLSQTRYTASGSPVEYVEFSYKDGFLESKTVKDAEGKLVTRRAYSFGLNGLIEAETLSDRTGKRLSGFEYRYDGDGRRVSWIVKDAKDTPIAETVYEYANGRLRRAELHDGSGRKTGSSDYEYEGDRLVRQNFYDALGSLVRVETNAWKNGKVVLEEKKSAGGAVQQRTAYEYGSDGQLVKKTLEDVVGKSTQITTYEYAFKEERRTIEE